MPSSISNSDPLSGSAPARGAPISLGRILRMLARVGVPIGVVACLFIAAVAFWNRSHPQTKNIYRTIEDTIVDEQIARSHTMPVADVLVIGDSSALMDVDPLKLGELLHKRVESLAMIAWVGPRGYARVLIDYAARVHAIDTVVVLINETGLTLTNEEYAKYGDEDKVLRQRPPPARGLISRARTAMYEQIVARLVARPLPGTFGERYGWPDDFATEIDDHHGRCNDPDVYTDNAPPPMRFQIGAATAERLPALGRALREVAPKHVFFSITPAPATRIDPTSLAERDATIAAIATALNLPTRDALPLPASFAANQFATITHLAASGRAAYTEILAKALAEKLTAD